MRTDGSESAQKHPFLGFSTLKTPKSKEKKRSTKEVLPPQTDHFKSLTDRARARTQLKFAKMMIEPKSNLFPIWVRFLRPSCTPSRTQIFEKRGGQVNSDDGP